MSAEEGCNGICDSCSLRHLPDGERVKAIDTIDAILSYLLSEPECSPEDPEVDRYVTVESYFLAVALHQLGINTSYTIPGQQLNLFGGDAMGPMTIEHPLVYCAEQQLHRIDSMCDEPLFDLVT